MTEESNDQDLQKIEEFILDEDKIVTFTWLSKILNVHIDDSKQLLKRYLESQKKEQKCKLEVIYWVSGILHDDNLKVELIKEDDINSKISNYKNVITKFIYGIYKCKQNNRKSLLLADQSNFQKNLIPGFIKTKKCVKRVFKEKHSLPPLVKTDISKKRKKSFFDNFLTKKGRYDSKTTNEASTSGKQIKSRVLNNESHKFDSDSESNSCVAELYVSNNEQLITDKNNEKSNSDSEDLFDSDDSIQKNSLLEKDSVHKPETEISAKNIRSLEDIDENDNSHPKGNNKEDVEEIPNKLKKNKQNIKNIGKIKKEGKHEKLHIITVEEFNSNKDHTNRLKHKKGQKQLANQPTLKEFFKNM